jgi:hypothetical protein
MRGVIEYSEEHSDWYSDEHSDENIVCKYSSEYSERVQ